MSLISVRPPVARLVVRVYGRTLHPELFEVLVLRRVVRPGFSLTARLTPGGHVLEFTTSAGTVTELLTTADAEAPVSGVALERGVAGGQRGTTHLPAARYSLSVHAEVLAPEVYAHAHAELIEDGAKRGLLAHFPNHHGLGLAPLAYLTVDPVPGGLAVAAFHSFPDEWTVVKTQSLLEFSVGGG